MSHAKTIQKLTEAFNRQDAGAIASLFAGNAVVHDPFYPEPLRGREAIEKDMKEFFRGFPDMHSDITTRLENGDSTAEQWSLKGTHAGTLAGPEGDIPATGRKVTMGVGTFTRFNDKGEIVEQHRYYDVAGLLTQLGITQQGVV